MLSQTKLQGIKDHLEELEWQTEGILRIEPRREKYDCPILNFAPDCNKEGAVFDRVERFYPDVVYTSSVTYYSDIYTQANVLWWNSLGAEQATAYTNAIIEWLKERR